MEKPAEKSSDFRRLITDWQGIEEKMVEYIGVQRETSKHPLLEAMLELLELDAQKYCRLQQMILASVNKEALHLSPEELGTLSAHINRRLEMEDKVLALAEEAAEKSEVFYTRYLLQYLISSVKKENSLLRKFGDEIKSAHISTSATSKTYA